MARKMLSVSDMSKALNCLNKYDVVRAEIEEDHLRAILFVHLAESMATYELGCEMQLLVRLQLAFGLESHLFDVMYSKAVRVSRTRNNIRTKLSFVETWGLKACMREITTRLDRNSIGYKTTAFRRTGKISRHSIDGFRKKAGSLVQKILF